MLGVPTEPLHKSQQKYCYAPDGSCWAQPYQPKQDQERTYKRNAAARSRNDCCRAKARSITYSVCL
jgi:hypothetical protein